MKSQSDNKFESIDEIIKDEIEKSKQIKTSTLSPDIKKSREASYKICQVIFEAIINEPLPYYFTSKNGELLIKLIRRIKLNNSIAHSTFSCIEAKLNDELKNFEEEKEQHKFLLISIQTLNFTAVHYFEEYLVEEFKDVHIAEILNKVKYTLERLDTYGDQYFREALLGIKKDVERRIELQKEEMLNRSQIYEPGESIYGKQELKTKIKKHKDLTAHRAILLMKHLAPRLKGCDQNKVAEVIAFLTGLESEGIRQGFSEVKNKFLNHPKAYNEDVKIVCGYLNLIGLTNEVENIKKDSGVT